MKGLQYLHNLRYAQNHRHNNLFNPLYIHRKIGATFCEAGAMWSGVNRFFVMKIKTSLRFKIFERDNFTCQYCGRKPPEVILHCDHIHPKSKGGDNNELNLLTSCRDCNLGKKDKILKNPQKSDIQQEITNLKEAEQQIKEYYKYLKKLANFKENNPIIDLICETWEEQSDGENSISELGKKNLKAILKNNQPEDIIEAIKISFANSRISNENKWKYMCGTLKNLRLQRENPELAKERENFFKTYYRLKEYWENQPKGSGYLPDYQLKSWLKNYSEEKIKSAMDESKGCWATLKEKFQ